MKIITKECNAINGEIIIVPIADVHLGDAQCNESNLVNTIEYIKEHDNAYTILNGDIINNALKNSKSDIYSDTISPQSQLALAIKYFKPLADLGKIIAITDGNHEDRTWKEVALSPMAILCSSLGIPETYAPEGAYIFLSTTIREVGEHCVKNVFTIYVQHGSGGGGKPGSKINALDKMDEVTDADIYIHSHSHMPGAIKEGYYRVNRSKKELHFAERLYVNTNAFLYYGGYGHKKGYKPASMSVPKIRLIARRVSNRKRDIIETSFIAEI